MRIFNILKLRFLLEKFSPASTLEMIKPVEKGGQVSRYLPAVRREIEPDLLPTLIIFYNAV